MKKTWITEGYEKFAFGGPKGLKIEQLAKRVKKNKSSFYHHFCDLEIFIDKLLDHHLAQAAIVAAKETEAGSQEELIEIIVFHKIDLLFNRQLRIHRVVPRFRACFEKVSAMTTPSLMEVWAKILDLNDHPHLAALILKLGIENFYLQITEETLNPEWLNHYFAEFKQLVREFKSAKNLAPLDGSV